MKKKIAVKQPAIKLVVRPSVKVQPKVVPYNVGKLPKRLQNAIGVYGD